MKKVSAQVTRRDRDVFGREKVALGSKNDKYFGKTGFWDRGSILQKTTSNNRYDYQDRVRTVV
jgi:hypothetical protein